MQFPEKISVRHDFNSLFASRPARNRRYDDAQVFLPHVVKLKFRTARDRKAQPGNIEVVSSRSAK